MNGRLNGCRYLVPKIYLFQHRYDTSPARAITHDIEPGNMSVMSIADVSPLFSVVGSNSKWMLGIWNRKKKSKAQA